MTIGYQRPAVWKVFGLLAISCLHKKGHIRADRVSLSMALVFLGALVVLPFNESGP